MKTHCRIRARILELRSTKSSSTPLTDSTRKKGIIALRVRACGKPKRHILNRPPYDRNQVEMILEAYRTMFPDTGGELTRYWDTGRKREWSYVTTDFHTATYDKLADLHARTIKIDKINTFGKIEKGEALRKASRECGVGFSLGICPWTDNLLHETYAPEKNRLIILLGHDWYPIVPIDRPNSDMPLGVEGLHHVPKYKTAAPQLVFTNESPVVLFLNIYPDYRPPGARTTGSLPKGAYSYKDCLLGLDAVIASVSSRYQKINLISWGANTWGALRERVTHEGKQKGIMNQAREHGGKVLNFNSSCCQLPYLPLAHPCFDSNFRKDFHLRHVFDGFVAMGLGRPGEKTSYIESDKTVIARLN